jgi:hypothetical protein
MMVSGDVLIPGRRAAPHFDMRATPICKRMWRSLVDAIPAACSTVTMFQHRRWRAIGKAHDYDYAFGVLQKIKPLIGLGFFLRFSSRPGLTPVAPYAILRRKPKSAISFTRQAVQRIRRE